MSTTDPADNSQPVDPRAGIAADPAVADPTVALAAAAAATGSATTALTKTEEGFKPAAPVWTPRPHEQLSPEDKDPADLTDDELDALTQGETSKGVVGGAFAIAAGALGLASITGTWVSNVVYERQQLIGSIASSGKSSAQVISAEYATPWHRVAMINGFFAIGAVVIGLGVLIGGYFLAARPMPGWARAVAWAALGLGIIGLVISGVMYFDWGIHTIIAPPASSSSTGG
ncbi:hypothetical protein [Streptacidiphilus sp. P02-A3a]|uniref:hypothetical protein n=1 Tax=Streptacidiphilus sp. P02-A3a TaxID=2704468 RepID=UPI0015F8432E|nr:hypothetical protein [Streptacidiphilus sp. P02-A3a]QMU67955.1 hypothetical protein GXP74_06675 [Streptacidiphilus sp. P02-A3a]